MDGSYDNTVGAVVDKAYIHTDTVDTYTSRMVTIVGERERSK